MRQQATPRDNKQTAETESPRPVSSSIAVREARGTKLSRGLGWFSLGLGIAELVAPRLIARFSGVRGNPSFIRAAGLREIVTGLGLLTSPTRAPWAWARVWGDVLDVAMLTRSVILTRRPDFIRVASTFSQIAAITSLDLYIARSLDIRAAGSRLQRDIGETPHNYSRRSGFRQPPEQMRGVALYDFDMPRDMMTPPALQSYLRRRERPGTETS